MPKMSMLLRSSSLLMVALFLLTLLTGCGNTGLASKLPPPEVRLSADCEALAQRVSHYPVTRGVTDARTAYQGERSRVNQANERLDATKDCQEAQRLRLGGKNAD